MKSVDWHFETDDDFWNIRSELGSLAPPDRIDDGISIVFTPGDVEKRVYVEDYTARNAAFGNGLGEWEIYERVSGAQVRVRGRRRKHLTFSREFPTRVFITDPGDELRFPDHLGYKIEILSGKYAGQRYDIAQLFDRSGRDLSKLDSGVDALSLAAPIGFASFGLASAAELTGGVPATGFEVSESVDWRLVPVFPTDAGPLGFVLADRGTVAGQTLTLASSLPGGAPCVVDVDLCRLRTATAAMSAEKTSTPASPGPTSHFPFYLADSFGFLRRFLPTIMPATLQIRFDELYRDLSGIHVQDP